MASTVLIKNVTVSHIEFSFGDTVKAGETDDYSHIPRPVLLKSADLIASITAGDVVVSDGIQEFSPANGVLYLQGRYVEPEIPALTVPVEELDVGDNIAWDGEKWSVSPNNAAQQANEVFATIFPQLGSHNLPLITDPTINDGKEICSIPFTLLKATSKVRIQANIQMGTEDHRTEGLGLLVFRDTTLIGGAALTRDFQHKNFIATTPLSILLQDEPNDTIEHTYSIRAGSLNKSRISNWFVGKIFPNNWAQSFSNSSSVVIKEIQ